MSQQQLKDFVRDNQIELEHAKEWKLAKFILKFPEIVLKAFDDLLLHSICDYIYELASVFTEFYDVLYCIQKDKQTGPYSTNLLVPSGLGLGQDKVLK